MQQLLGHVLRSLRKEANLSGRAVAKDMGISASELSKYENGRVKPSKQRVSAFCKALRLNSRKANSLLAMANLADISKSAHKFDLREWLDSFLDIMDSANELKLYLAFHTGKPFDTVFQREQRAEDKVRKEMKFILKRLHKKLNDKSCSVNVIACIGDAKGHDVDLFEEAIAVASAQPHLEYGEVPLNSKHSSFRGIPCNSFLIADRAAGLIHTGPDFKLIQTSDEMLVWEGEFDRVRSKADIRPISEEYRAELMKQISTIPTMGGL